MAAGVRYLGSDGGPAPVTIWRSENGQDWEDFGSIDVGWCRSDCPSIGPLAAGPSGSVIGWVSATDGQVSSVYRSRNGSDWKPVPRTDFGLGNRGRLDPVAVIAVGSRFVLVAGRSNCRTCAARVWISDDGLAWQKVAELEHPQPVGPYRLNIATDGQRVVVADEWCNDAVCFTDIWLSTDHAESWTLQPDAVIGHEPQLAFAENVFVVVGRVHDRVIVETSPDGVSWHQTETDIVLRDRDECELASLAGGPDGVLLLVDDCDPQLLFSEAP